MRVDDRPCDLMPDERATMYREVGKAVEAASFYTLTPTEKFQAHRHILVNCPAVKKFLEAITKRKLRSKTRSQSHTDSVIHREFPEWFKCEVNPVIITPFRIQMASCRLYPKLIKHFRTLSREEGLKIQNGGVYVTSDTRSYASKRDSNVAIGSVEELKIDGLEFLNQATNLSYKCVVVTSNKPNKIYKPKYSNLGSSSQGIAGRSRTSRGRVVHAIASLSIFRTTRARHPRICVVRAASNLHGLISGLSSVLYYGKIVDIIELNYSGQFTVFLFRCIWANTTSGRGIKQDSLGHTLVNFSHPIHTGAREDDESYILVSETLLVYYMDDAVDQEWSVVVHVNPRDMTMLLRTSPQLILTGLSKFDVKGLSLRRDDDLEESTTDAIDACEEDAD
ncbi:hypothetical protein AHAS_Ahas05G0073800 [Arachis hypogaea]